MFPDGTTQITAGGAGGGPAPGTNAFIGGITVSSLATPGTPTVAPQGTAGTTTYSYRITARSLVGETLASPAGTTTTGNATLGATNFNRITWASVSGAVDYRIYRTASGGTPATTGLIGTTTSLIFDDTGLAASGAVPTVDNSGNVGIGTLSPTTRLDIEGQIRIRGGSPLAGRVLTADATGLATWATPAGGLPTGTASQTLRHDGTNWVANSNIFNTGTNIGIGTTTPGARLEVAGNIIADPPIAQNHVATRGWVEAAASGGARGWDVCQTASSFTGNLGGYSGANAICAAACGVGFVMLNTNHLIAAAQGSTILIPTTLTLEDAWVGGGFLHVHIHPSATSWVPIVSVLTAVVGKGRRHRPGKTR